MTLDSIHAPTDLLPATIAGGITAAIVISALVLLAIDVFRTSDRQFPAPLFGTLIIAGILSVLTAGSLYMGASTDASKAEDLNFQHGLKSAYGITSSATIDQADEGQSVVVSGPHGNELVTLRKTSDQLLAFHPDGTELHRVAQ